MLIKKIWNYMIEIKKEFVLKKKNEYPLSKEKRYTSLLINNWERDILDSQSYLK